MQTMVPAPSTPPKENPIAAKTPSTMSLIIPNFVFVVSDITTATRSVGPVPASEFISPYKFLHNFMINEKGEKMKVKKRMRKAVP